MARADAKLLAMAPPREGPSRRAVLHGTTALAGLGLAGCGPGLPSIRAGAPVVFLFIDQLRADSLGYAGNPVVRSPNIDKLAADSVRFDTCVTNAPVCRPARVTMMTGRPVADHGIWTNRLEPRPDLPSHVRRMREEGGYHTAVIGKTHLHEGRGHFADHVQRLDRWGFNDAIELPDPQQYWMRSAHSDWLQATTGKGEVDKFARWQDYVQTYTWDQAPPDLAPWNLSTDDHLDSFCGRAAADYLRSYAEDAPLYLQVNFPGPHKPFDPTSEFTAPLDPEDPSLPLPILEAPRPPVSPINLKYQGIKLEDWTEATARKLRVDYYAKIGLVDRALGQVLQALRDTGMYDESWVILMSDHGELLADHMMTGKVLVYEPSIRVPLLIKPPGGRPATSWDDSGTIDLLDVVATILAAGGVDPAGDGDTPLVGRVAEGPEGSAAHRTKPVLFENMEYVGLRTSRYTLGWDLAMGRPVELFDNVEDPEQRTNVVEEPDRRPVLDDLVELLRDRRALPVDNHRR